MLLAFAHKMAGHAAYLLVAGVVAAIDFKNTVTTGSILLTAVVLAFAGLFTIRSHAAKVWRDDAEGQRAAKELLQEQLATERADRAGFDREQQELRHALTTDLATEQMKVQALEAKTDFTVALEKIREMNADLAGQFARQIADTLRESAKRSEDRDKRTHALLEAIRDRLPDDPATFTPLSRKESP